MNILKKIFSNLERIEKMGKKDGIKIVTIGGGSSYTPELIEGFIKRIKVEIWLKEWWKRLVLTARFI